jgi:hypothetical protein
MEVLVSAPAPMDEFFGPGCIVCGATDGEHAPWCTREAPHPVPHPGCIACDPALMAARLRHLGVRPRAERWVSVNQGEAVLYLPPGADGEP